MSKSAIYTANTSPSELVISTAYPFATIPLGSTIRRFGCNLQQVGNGIAAQGTGYYKINASVTLTPTAAGNVTVVAFKDGVAIPGATATESVTTAGNTVSVPITAIIRNTCCDSSTLTFALTTASATINNIAVTVEKL